MADTVFATAYISAHSSRTALSTMHIRAMLAAATVGAAAQVLTELGYEITGKTDDQIIDERRAGAFATFMELCTDPALADIIRARYNFVTTRRDQSMSYVEAERALLKNISELIPAVKNADIRAYLRTAIDGKPMQEVACKNDLDTMGPLLHWYMGVQNELKIVKTLLMGKRFDFGRDVIVENLKTLGVAL